MSDPTGLDVGRLCLGGNVFGWTADAPTSHAILDAFTAGGGRFVDTADVYAAWAEGNVGGESERIIGDWLASRPGRRGEVVIATKVAKAAPRRGLSPANVRAAIRDSLARLRTDFVDLYYCHEDDPTIPVEDVVGTFSELIDAGLVRAWGLSNYAADRVAEVVATSDSLGLPRPVAVQPQYSLVHRGEVETSGLGEVCLDRNLAIVPYYALASGFLTGKYTRTQRPEGARSGGVARFCTEAGFAVLDVADALARRHGVAVASVALAWLRARPGVVAPIASARTVDQVGPLLSAMELELADSELAALDEVSRPWLS